MASLVSPLSVRQLKLGCSQSAGAKRLCVEIGGRLTVRDVWCDYLRRHSNSGGCCFPPPGAVAAAGCH